MPWLSEAMKDVVSCEKLRGVANELWSVDFRMGKPSALKMQSSTWVEREPGELKHLSNRRKRKQFSDSVSSGERKRNSPNLDTLVSGGCRTTDEHFIEAESFGKLNQRGWQSRKRKMKWNSGILSRAGSETPCLNLPAPSGKAKYSRETDSEQVLWRKGEKNPKKGS